MACAGVLISGCTQGLLGAFMAHLGRSSTGGEAEAEEEEEGGAVEGADGAEADRPKFVPSKAVGWRRMRPHVKVRR